MKFKNGGELVFLPSERDRNFAQVIGDLERAVDAIRESGPFDLAGYALVAWGASEKEVLRTIGASPGNPMWDHEIPDYVRGQLQSYINTKET